MELTKYDIYRIKDQNRDLISICKKILSELHAENYDISDPEDVISIMLEIVTHSGLECDFGLCIIAAYVYNISIIEGMRREDHNYCWIPEEEMRRLRYNTSYINVIEDCVKNFGIHGSPQTVEACLLRDADKLAWLSPKRWDRYLAMKKHPSSILKRLEFLRNDILHFDQSKVIYDRMVIQVLAIVMQRIKKSNREQSMLNTIDKSIILDKRDK